MTTDPLMDELARIEESVRASDGEAILARWDFGQRVLAQRVGKQLPKGMVADICERVGISPKELSNRTRVAEHYDRVQVCSSLQTWTALVTGLPPKHASPKRPPKPPAAPATKATLSDANRVEALISKPDVAAELSRRDAADAAARKAQQLAERRERAKAKAQKERDQEAEHIAHVLRLRLIQGDDDWQNLTEQMETMADTVKRLVALLEGLPIPDDLHRKMFVRHLADTQQALFQLRMLVAAEQYGEEPSPVSTVASTFIEATVR